MSDQFIYNYYKEWWKGKTNPHHRHNSEEWFEAYYKEFRFHISNTCHSIVDVGCGSGEITVKFAKDYEKVIGIDYSESIVEEARKNTEQLKLSNLRLYCSDMLQIKEVLGEEKVDLIFCNQAVQYLTTEQLAIFVANCKATLTDSGVILLMNVPNRNMKSLFIANLFHRTDEFTSLSRIVVRNLIHQFHSLKQRLLNRDRSVDGIGYWFTQGELKNIADKNKLKIEFFNSMYSPYGYRFHAKLSKS